MTIFLVFVEQKRESCALPEQKITCYSDSLPICTLLNRILVFGLISWEKRTIASWKNSLKNWLYWSSTNYFRFKHHSYPSYRRICTILFDIHFTFVRQYYKIKYDGPIVYNLINIINRTKKNFIYRLLFVNDPSLK